jgi:hypothetical protein
MSTHYSKVLSSGQRVEVDDINVTVDDSRYPTRNISAVHLRKAKDPGILVALLLIAFGAFCVISITLSVLGFSEGGLGPVSFGFVALFFGFKKLLDVKKICHAITFGSSGSERDAILVHALLSNNGLLDIIKAGFAWEESTRDSYNEIKECSNAISDAIDELQRKGS